MELSSFIKQRETRGLEIARTFKIVRLTDRLWSVPSQQGAGTYVVDLEAPSCGCEDFETHGLACKHVYAARHARDQTGAAPEDERSTMSKKSKTEKKPRPTYAQPSWRVYEQAQIHEKPDFQVLLKDLVSGIEQPRYKGTGRPPLPLCDVIFAAAMQVYTGQSARRAASHIRECAEKQFIDKAAHYNTICKALNNPGLIPILKTLIVEAASPLIVIEHDFAVDSTNFGTRTYARWFDHKWGRDRKWQKWRKCHVMAGTSTHVVTSVEVTEWTSGDSLEFGGLVKSTAERFDVHTVCADKAYLGNANLTLVDEIGAVAYVPFKSNSRLKKGGEAWKRLWHYFHAHKEDFLRNYHQRSNVETTFSMLKRKFGGFVRAKTDVAQTNEILLKVLVHNIVVLCHEIRELGIEPKFWAPTDTTEAAE